MKALVLIFITILTAGCSSSYNITYDTDVDGAMLVCGGQNKGYTPTTLSYNISEESRSRGYLRTVECEARWVSGARDAFSTDWDLNRFPDGVRQTLPRPDEDGYAQDAEFALRVQQMKNQQSQANAAASAQAWRDLSQSIKNSTPKTTYTNCNRAYGGVDCTSTTY